MALKEGAFVILGVLNNVVPFTLFAFGETRISSGMASILNATTPLFGVLVTHFLTADERISGRKAAGVLLGFLGVAALIGSNAFADVAHGDVVGELACLGAALAMRSRASSGAASAACRR